MLKTYNYIQEELQNYYPISEIKTFASVIFKELFNISFVEIFSNSENIISKNDFSSIISIVNRLQNNEPIQYIFGKTNFLEFSFSVTKDVLIPRPETEELVEWVLKESSSLLPYRILDIGTGSGCIAISLAKRLEKSTVFAYDISRKALEIAKKNAENYSTTIFFRKFDILKNNFDEISEKFDIIISNPPYVTESEKLFMQLNVLEYEPKQALFVPDNNPLLFYKKIAEFAKKKLNPNGFLYFEVSSIFGKDTLNMLKQMGFLNVILEKDISGKDRMIQAKL